MENVHIVKFNTLSVRPVSQGYIYLVNCFNEELNRHVQYNFFSPTLVTWIRENQYLKIQVDGVIGSSRWHALAITPLPNTTDQLTDEQRKQIEKFQHWIMFQEE